MKFSFALLLVIGMVVGCASIKETGSQENKLAALSWLSGSWSGKAWGSRFDAFYSTPEGGKILSISELFKDGEVMYHEFECFEIAENKIVLTPYPAGSPAERFELVHLDTRLQKAVFENPDKDYPTRIAYQRLNDRELMIILSDPYGNSDKVEQFEFDRVTTAGEGK